MWVDDGKYNYEKNLPNQNFNFMWLFFSCSQHCNFCGWHANCPCLFINSTISVPNSIIHKNHEMVNMTFLIMLLLDKDMSQFVVAKTHMLLSPSLWKGTWWAICCPLVCQMWFNYNKVVKHEFILFTCSGGVQTRSQSEESCPRHLLLLQIARSLSHKFRQLHWLHDKLWSH